MKTFHIGGIHPPETKLTARRPVADVAIPAEIALMLSQHIGAPAKPVVAKGDHVDRGQLVAEAGGFVSAPVHSPVSGTVMRLTTVKNPQGFDVDAIIIKADAEQPQTAPVPRDTDSLSADDIRRAIAAAGIVGLGGATFPTPVKLSPPPGTKAEIVIINGVECEPYLTCDHALMLDHPEEILRGTSLLMRAVGVSRAAIAIEANKPDVIELMRSHAGKEYARIEIVPLKVKYPQGGEKQLIDAVIGRQVKSGALPISEGAVVQNVATAYAVYRAVAFGEPLTGRLVTVTGPGVRNPGNFRVALGTPLKALIEAAGGLTDDAAKVIIGGPMMGRAAMTLDSYTTKGLSGIVVMTGGDARRRPVEACIRCGACVEACPMGLEPYLISRLSSLHRFEDAEARDIADCIECGSCSFVCPASRPILDFIRVGKGAVMAARRRAQQSKTSGK